MSHDVGLLVVAVFSSTAAAALSCGVINIEKATLEPQARQRQASPKGFVEAAIAPSVAAAHITADSWASQPAGMAAAGAAPVPGPHQTLGLQAQGSLVLLAPCLKEPGGSVMTSHFFC